MEHVAAGTPADPLEDPLDRKVHIVFFTVTHRSWVLDGAGNIMVHQDFEGGLFSVRILTTAERAELLTATLEQTRQGHRFVRVVDCKHRAGPHERLNTVGCAVTAGDHKIIDRGQDPFARML